jgi:hypothetical protein
VVSLLVHRVIGPLPRDMVPMVLDYHGLAGQPAGTLAGGEVSQVTLGSGLALGNNGDTLILSDANGATIDTVTYTATQVHPGRTICFGRTRTAPLDYEPAVGACSRAG